MKTISAILLFFLGVYQTEGFFTSDVNHEDISFHLYTRDNFEYPVEIQKENPAALNNKNVQIVFIIHGWYENRQKQWYEELKNAYLNKLNQEYYVVQVDWSLPAQQIYPISKSNTKHVGNILAKFITKLNDDYDIPFSNIEITGHSLGGHVAGFTGKYVHAFTGHKIKRITALDPAGPLFEGSSILESNRLSKDDAEVVAVLHTDVGVFGYERPCGTIDFYPNGGHAQPGCPDFLHLEVVFCSHWRSFKFFIEALENENMIATKCSNYDTYLAGTCDSNDIVSLGDDISSSKTGNYYFQTNSRKPFVKKD